MKIIYLLSKKKNKRMKRLTKEEFILKARQIHGWKYDYSKVVYLNNRTPVCIICPEHGEFWQTPNTHLDGTGCKKCSNEKKSKTMKKNVNDFIKQARKIHGDKYDYSMVKYEGTHKPVCIICPEHGEFWQTPSLHLRTNGCKKCTSSENGDKRKLKKNDFIKKAKEIHGDKYDYTKIEYKDYYTPVTIICPVHGEFKQKPYLHVFGQGCKKCGDERKNKGRTKSVETFIKESNTIHNNKYDYSKVEYVNNHTKVCIICHEKDANGNEHGEFWQTPNRHLNKNGCPKCKESKIEREISILFDNSGIKYEKWKKFKWLGKQSLDFYIPESNIAIECQGMQHFMASKNEKSYYTKEKIQEIQKRDENKKKLCEENGVKLLYYSNFSINFPYEVITDKNKLLKIIKDYV